MIISGRQISDKDVFVIAEIGNNHNGSLDRAFNMVELAHKAGADCVKFQIRNMKSLYRSKSINREGDDLGTEYILDLLDRFQLSVDDHRKIYDYCKKIGIIYMCTPWDHTSVDILEDFGVPAYKVASADLTNIPLISKIIKTKKPMILSTGMSTESEIKTTTRVLKGSEIEFALLHCNSTYPAPFHDINLNWMNSLKKIHNLIGYSGHERGISVSLGAVTMGAMIIERHFTIDRNMEGPDHAASLEFDEFKALVKGISEIKQAMGTANARGLSQGEMINRENLGKSLVAATGLKKGTEISDEHILVRSPGQGLSPQFKDKLIGKIAQRDIKKEDYYYLSDIEEKTISARDYDYKRPWGVPVRYHDFDEYNSKIKPNLFEFHLSYKDLDLDLDHYLKGIYECGFVVHAPELFSESRLMDLATPDEKYRKFSIKETQRVIDITRDLKKYFPNENMPMIVANIGGFSMDEPLPENVIDDYYKRFGDSLKELDLDGVELIPQTMAPFPWHFGGQRYQNLFVHCDEIVKWCKLLDLRMCFDISHSALMCNHFDLDFYEFSENIAPITGHLHLGDASGVNAEGLQIGEGDINYERLSKILAKGCPKASFIPEIWQGHKNSGEGFWLALDKLERYF